MNTIELNEDQIRRIEARLNLLHMDMVECKDKNDLQGYGYAAGRTNGICMMLDELGYNAVWMSDVNRCKVWRQSDGRK